MVTYLEPSASALMTLPSARSDLLMLAPSRMRAPPLECATEAFSDPARSIIDSFATFTSALSPELRGRCFTYTCRKWKCWIEAQVVPIPKQ